MKLSTVRIYKVLYTCIFSFPHALSLIHAQPKEPSDLSQYFNFPHPPKQNPHLQNLAIPRLAFLKL